MKPQSERLKYIFGFLVCVLVLFSSSDGEIIPKSCEIKQVNGGSEEIISNISRSTEFYLAPYGDIEMELLANNVVKATLRLNTTTFSHKSLMPVELDLFETPSLKVLDSESHAPFLFKTKGDISGNISFSLHVRHAWATGSCKGGLLYQKVSDIRPEQIFPLPSGKELHFMIIPSTLLCNIQLLLDGKATFHLCWDSDFQKPEVKTESCDCPEHPVLTVASFSLMHNDTTGKLQINNVTMDGNYMISKKELEFKLEGRVGPAYIVQCLKGCRSLVDRDKEVTCSAPSSLSTTGAFFIGMAVILVGCVLLWIIFRVKPSLLENINK